MNKNILDYYAQNRTPYLHGGGRKASLHLFHQLNIKGNETILEIGFGIGASLMSLQNKFPELNLFGVEKNAHMYQAAKQRLKSSQVNLNHLHLLNKKNPLPFSPLSFDIIYLESVLGILTLEHIQALLIEITRLLKPDGLLGLNDTLWLPWVPMNERQRINQSCIKAWGIPQSNEYLIHQKDWKKVLKKAGLELNYFDKWDAKHFNQRPSFKEHSTRLKDKIVQNINTLKKENRKKATSLKTLTKKLFIEDKAYLNSYIMTAKKINNE